MKTVVSLSIPKSGTWFVANEILFMFKKLGIHGAPSTTRNICLVGHFGVPSEQVLIRRLMREHTTVVPVRHPLSCARSWEELGLDVERMLALYHELAFLQGPLFLPIDSLRRDMFLQTIAEALATPLYTHWLRRPGCAKPMVTAALRSMDKVIAFLASHRSFMDRLYGLSTG